MCEINSMCFLLLRQRLISVSFTVVQIRINSRWNRYMSKLENFNISEKVYKAICNFEDIQNLVNKTLKKLKITVTYIGSPREDAVYFYYDNHKT